MDLTFEHHICTLFDDRVDLLTPHIDSGIFVQLRRSFRRLLLIDYGHPKSKLHFKSISAVTNESMRHLLTHYYMIHPYSKLILHWSLLMNLAYLCYFVFAPLGISVQWLSYHCMDSSFGTIQSLIIFVADIVCFIDIALNFFIGFYDSNLHKVILSPKTIARRYLTTFFLVDFLSSSSTIIVLIMIKYEIDYTYRIIVAFTRFIKIFRYPRFLATFDLYQQFFDISDFAMNLSKGIISYILGFCWFACLVLFLNVVVIIDKEKCFGTTDPQEQMHLFLQLILNSIAQTAYLLFLVDLSSNSSKEPFIQVIYLLLILCGFIIHLVLIAHMIQLHSIRNNPQKSYGKVMLQIEQFVKLKEIPIDLQVKIYTYLEFSLRKQYYKTNDILGILTPLLRNDITFEKCGKLIENVPIFKYLKQDQLTNLLKVLQMKIFLPNDVIVQPGGSIDEMYFVQLGTVAIYNSNKVELTHLDNGSYFGEVSLLFNIPPNVFIVAVTACKLLLLSRTDFMNILKPSRKIMSKMKKSATARLKTMNQVLN